MMFVIKSIAILYENDFFFRFKVYQQALSTVFNSHSWCRYYLDRIFEKVFLVFIRIH